MPTKNIIWHNFSSGAKQNRDIKKTFSFFNLVYVSRLKKLTADQLVKNAKLSNRELFYDCSILISFRIISSLNNKKIHYVRKYKKKQYFRRKSKTINTLEITIFYHVKYVEHLQCKTLFFPLN